MRTSKFDVPVEVLTDFLDASCDKRMNSTIVSKTRNEYNIEIDYEKEETSVIDELEEELETLIENIDEEESEDDGED